jgi:hypothetical protein
VFRAGIATALVLVLQLSAQARAQAPTPEQRAAIAAFEEGDRLSAAQRWAEACAKYTESQRLDPQLGALLHVADCNERIGKLATAWRSFSAAVELAQQRRDSRLPVARERAAALQRRLSYLSIVVTDAPPYGFELTLDGVALTEAQWREPIALDPGEHQLLARAPDKLDFTHTFQVVAARSSEQVRVPPLEPAPTLLATAPSVNERAQHERASEPGGVQRVLGWVALGVGVGAGVTSAVLFNEKGRKAEEARVLQREFCADCADAEQQALEREQQSKQLARDQEQLRDLGIAAAAVGGAAIIGGLVLLLTAPDGEDDLALSPAIGPHTQALLVTGSF